MRPAKPGRTTHGSRPAAHPRGSVPASRASESRGRIDRGSRESTAYMRLRALVVNGALAPGSPLIESDLSARLNLSRTPVRAALLRLEQEGFVRFRASGARARRAVVSPLTTDDLREVFLMVGALEATAAREAAALESERREALEAELDRANEAMRAALAGRPPLLTLAQDEHVRFHRACVDAVAGPRLCAELDVLAPQAERYQRVYSAATMYAADEFLAAHEAIMAAIRRRQPDVAEQSVAADWRLAAQRHADLIAVMGERGNW